MHFGGNCSVKEFSWDDFRLTSRVRIRFSCRKTLSSLCAECLNVKMHRRTRFSIASSVVALRITMGTNFYRTTFGVEELRISN